MGYRVPGGQVANFRELAVLAPGDVLVLRPLKKIALHVMLAFMVTTPSVQSLFPLHPLNTHPAAGVAVKATIVSSGKAFLQTSPQLIPAGELVTCPLPHFATLRVNIEQHVVLNPACICHPGFDASPSVS